MSRISKIILLLIVVLAALLTINTIVLNNQTQAAKVTVEGGQLFETESGIELQYTDEQPAAGDEQGQPIVLLHCYTCSSQWWNAVKPLLSERHRVITVDLIGHGGSSKPSSGYEISAQSTAVAELLADLGVSGATVIGHSMGGLVATSLAEQASEVVDRVVLIGVPSGTEQSELPFTARLATTPVIGHALWRAKLDSMVKSAYADSFAPGFDAEEAFPDNPDQVLEDIDNMTYTSFSASRDAADDFQEEQTVASRLTATGVPVLAILGTEDQVVQVEEAIEGYRSVPGARIEQMDGSGHSSHVEDPDATVALVLPFVAAGTEFAPPPPPEPSGPQPGPGDNAGGGPDDDTSADGEQPENEGPENDGPENEGPGNEGPDGETAG